jgi:hypothetical protein
VRAICALRSGGDARGQPPPTIRREDGRLFSPILIWDNAVEDDVWARMLAS